VLIFLKQAQEGKIEPIWKVTVVADVGSRFLNWVQDGPEVAEVGGRSISSAAEVTEVA
jgi:hypothetical protein